MEKEKENKSKAKEPEFESLDDVIAGGSFDDEIDEDDFFDSLDNSIDDYYGKLRKK